MNTETKYNAIQFGLSIVASCLIVGGVVATFVMLRDTIIRLGIPSPLVAAAVVVPVVLSVFACRFLCEEAAHLIVYGYSPYKLRRELDIER